LGTFKSDVLLKPQDSGQDFLSMFAQVFNQNSNFKFGLSESGNPTVSQNVKVQV
jgi:hypothetical protein